MNPQQSGALSLASTAAFQLTQIDAWVERGLPEQEEAGSLLLCADAKSGESAARDVASVFLTDLRRDLRSSTIRSPAAARRGDGASAGFALALSADRDPQRSAGGSRTESQRWGSAKANRRTGLCRVPDKGSRPRCCGLAGLSTPPQVARGKPVDARRACLVTPKRSS